MHIIPAIDLLGGKVVRLYKGRRHSFTEYSDDPAGMARKWKECGADLLHVVDLDAAFGEGDNIDSIKSIIDVGVPVQVGGGIRDLRRASQLSRLKVKRLIVGTKSFEETFMNALISCCPSQKLGVSIDVLDGKVMKEGWKVATDYYFLDLIDTLSAKGIQWFVYTDISRDGTLKGANIQDGKKLEKVKGVHFILSGGIKSMADMVTVKKELPFLYGVIAGRAIYENFVDLADAIRTLS